MRACRKVLAYVIWSVFVSGPVLPAVAQETAALDKSLTSTLSKATAASSSASEREAKPTELPDSPGAILAKSGEAVQAQEQLSAALSSPQDSLAQDSASQSSEDSAQSSPQKPVGTAAAEAAHTTGVAASQPAGVAIAPGKQHRVRTIVLRTGAIIGAGVAVGAVVALSEATSSKPPGAH
jgi:hypothetical protein